MYNLNDVGYVPMENIHTIFPEMYLSNYEAISLTFKILDDGSFSATYYPLEDGSAAITYAFQPVAEEGYEFDHWNIGGKKLYAGDTYEWTAGDIIKATIDYKDVPIPPEPDPEPDPSPEPTPAAAEGSAQTGDCTPIAGLAVIGIVAVTSLIVSRKKNKLFI